MARPVVPTCPDCDMEIMGEDDAERAEFYELHLGTVQHKLGLLGEAGKEAMRVVAEERDSWLYEWGFIPHPKLWSADGGGQTP